MRACGSRQEAASARELGVQHARAGGSALRVVTEEKELDAEHLALADPSDVDGHAAVLLDVEPDLRAVLRVVEPDRSRGRRREPELLARAAEGREGFAN